MSTTRKLIHVARAAFVTLTLASVSPTAHAEPSAADTAAAQALFDQGRQLASQGNYAEACPKFEESARIIGHSGTLLNLADCYEKQGRVSSAWTTFLSAAAAAKRTGNVDREAEARNRAAALAASLPKIVINVAASDKNSGVTITRDGMIVGQAQFGVAIPADPGTHKISASMPGHKSWETSIEIKNKGDVVQVDVPSLQLQPAAASGVQPTAMDSKMSAAHGSGVSKASPQRTWALVAGGVGAAGVVIGSVAGFVSLSKHNQAEDHCSGSLCRDSQGVSLRSDARSWGNVSTVAFVVGAAGLATGVTLWFTSPQSQTPSAAWLTVGPGSVAMQGAW